MMSSAMLSLRKVVVSPAASVAGASLRAMCTTTKSTSPLSATSALLSTASAAMKPKSNPRAYSPSPPRPSAKDDAPDSVSLSSRTDSELLSLIAEGRLSVHTLESALGDATRAVFIRRQHLVSQLAGADANPDAKRAIKGLPVSHFDADPFYKSVHGTNCESVVGFLPLPVGVVGPLQLDGKKYVVPLATTEGALIASTNRGARAIAHSGGAVTSITGNGMTRAPVLRMTSLAQAEALQNWLATPEAVDRLRAAFNSTTRFGKLDTVTCTAAGRTVYIRFRCQTGDAMGMNMISKGVNEALTVILDEFEGVKVMALSGNFCTDKKPAAVNWIEGRGKRVAAEVLIPEDVVRDTLKTTVRDMVALNIAKNLVGSAMAGSIGGYNAHAANIVTAVFLATGQDPAQNVESSNCITLMEEHESGGLLVSVTMPSVEVGTVGGGTSLPAQQACLGLLGVHGASKENPGENAEQLARIVAGSVLAGELSLMAALCSGDLISAHISLNRKTDDSSADASGSAPVAAAAAAAAAAAPPAGHTHMSTHTAAASPGRRYFEEFAAGAVVPEDDDGFTAEFVPRLSTP